MSQDKADTLPDKKDANQSPEGGVSGNTPAKQDGGVPQPSNQGKSGIEDLVMTELKKITGRITKLEQSKKGKSSDLPDKKAQFTFDYPDDEETQPSQELEQQKELLRFERGVTQILRSRKYDTLLNKDKTLDDVLNRNPLSFVNDPVDADDAVNQIQSYLDERLKETLGNQESEEQKVAEPVPPAPENIPANSDSKGEPSKENKDDRRSYTDVVADSLTKEITGNNAFLKLHR